MPKKQTEMSSSRHQKRLIIMGVLIVFVIGFYVSEQRAKTAGDSTTEDAPAVLEVSPKTFPSGGRGAVMRAAPAERKPDATGSTGVAEKAPEAISEPVKPASRPKPVLLADGKVRTVLAPGETLVTGGYLNTEGKWEFSMVTATVLGEGVHRQVVLSSSIMALDDAGVAGAGLSSLLTGEVETRQHGEVWKAGESQRILKGMEGKQGSELLSAPRITIAPGMEGTVEISSDDGVLIRMGAKADLLPDGNLDLTVSHKRQAAGK